MQTSQNRSVVQPSAVRRDAAVRRWLEDFAAAVRQVDYDRGRTMFAEDVVGFGTRNQQLVGLDALVERQWKRVWGCTRGFQFDLETLRANVSQDLATAAVMWNSEGRNAGGDWFQRIGRATFVLRRDADGAWRCVHSHLSRTPSDSL